MKEKLYLRGLFHRVRALIALNCSVIFVTGNFVSFFEKIYNGVLQKKKIKNVYFTLFLVVFIISLTVFYLKILNCGILDNFKI